MRKRIGIAAALLVAGVGAAAALHYDAAASVETIELDEAEVYIEWNSTDTDFGIQFFWDGSDWKSMMLRDHDDRKVMYVKVSGSVKAQGLTEGFFESVEPPADEVSMEEFFARFPEGDYTYRGKTLDGDILVGETELTHVMPAPPEGLYPVEDDVVSRHGFEAGFDPVTEDIDGEDLDVVYYELVVEKEDDDEFLAVFTVTLSPDQTTVWVPGEFLEPGCEYKLEVIATEESGNRTITEEGSFTTDDD